jgi:hypothetical protein
MASTSILFVAIQNYSVPSRADVPVSLSKGRLRGAMRG